MPTSARFDIRVVVAPQTTSLDVFVRFEIVASSNGARTFSKLFVPGFPDVLRRLLTLHTGRTAAALVRRAGGALLSFAATACPICLDWFGCFECCFVADDFLCGI